MNTIRISVLRDAFSLNADLALPPQGITAVFGASGSGKTTLLRCVAGLERATKAFVQIDGTVWQDDSRGIFMPTWQRPLGYVFQEASLFDHLDVRGNLAFGRKRARGESHGKVSLDEAVALLGIGHLLDRKTAALSGGERQRVAIARALASEPRLLLLDEPLASLDHARRAEILPWLERLRDELRIPMLYVTHSADEVVRLADTLVVLDQGRVLASGPLAETLARTDIPVAIGDDAGALLEGEVKSLDAKWQLALFAFDGGELCLPDAGLAIGRKARVRVLARDVSIAKQPPNATSIQNILPCEIASMSANAQGSQVVVQLLCGESKTSLLARITARAAHDLALAPGQRVWAQIKSAALVK